MKKFMIWSTIPPFNENIARNVIINNMFNDNTGNLLFHAGVERALMTDPDMEIIKGFKGVGNHGPDQLIELINAECSCLAIPLANAFRFSYVDKLEALTRLIKRLKIPCVVIGAGMQADRPERADEGYPFDDKAKAFINAVLDHSSMLGLRGGHTARYLKHLGYAEERHFTVIGCPSLYLYGSELPEPRLCELGRESRVSINSKLDSPETVHDLMARSCRELPNYWYVPQTIYEIRKMGYDIPIPKENRKPMPEYMSLKANSPLVRDRRAVAFFNVPSWIDFLRDKDFSYGCNIHGNIAAVLAGTPAMILAKDLRVEEIADYHELPHLKMSGIDENTRIIDAYERADYGPMIANHGARFAHFVDFLNANGLDHIYKDGSHVVNAPFDQRTNAVRQLPPFYARLPLTLEQRIDALKVWRRVWKKRRLHMKERKQEGRA